MNPHWVKAPIENYAGRYQGRIDLSRYAIIKFTATGSNSNKYILTGFVNYAPSGSYSGKIFCSGMQDTTTGTVDIKGNFWFTVNPPITYLTLGQFSGTTLGTLSFSDFYVLSSQDKIIEA